jgi:hypothetical protein
MHQTVGRGEQTEQRVLPGRRELRDSGVLAARLSAFNPHQADHHPLGLRDLGEPAQFTGPLAPTSQSC